MSSQDIYEETPAELNQNDNDNNNPICMCGLQFSNHSSEAKLSKSTQPWTIATSTKLLPTNASGILKHSDDITNDAVAQEQHYLRLALPDDFDGAEGGQLMENVSTWLSQGWGLKKPSMVLSIRGPPKGKSAQLTE